ncbi:MAG: hypothetical protein H3C31_00405 [Brumimicrobium sp.]|nr:hypothetical protein [Brumimicrobium sp.]MCO5268101.1 SiaB family protein kinase [Brumimicrobium sp.]
METIEQLYKSVKEEKALFSFVGVVTPDVISSVFYAVKSKLDEDETALKIKKRVFNILVECMQNLFHHTIDVDSQFAKLLKNNDVLKTSFFQIIQKGESYEITSGNFVSVQDEENLKERLEKINAMDSESLKEAYRQTLEKGSLSSKGTAGLGFLDIARKSGNKLGFDFKHLDKNLSFFILNIKIN